MKRTVRMLAFLALVVAVHLGLRHVFLTDLMSERRSLAKAREFGAHVGEVEVGMMGNSHVILSMETDLITHSYNLATLQEPYVVTYYRLRDLVRSGGRPFPVLLMQLDLHSFCGNELALTGSPVWGQYVDYFELARRLNKPREYLTQWLQYRVFPYAGCSASIIRYVSMRDASEKDVKNTPIFWDFSTRKDKDSAAWVRVNQHFKGTEWFNKEVASYLAQILDLCREHEIQVVLVEFPVSSAYYGAAAKLMPIEKWESNVADLLRGAPGVTVLDYRKLYFDREDLFGDCDHLNYRGADEFSRLVNGELIRRGLVGGK